MDADGYIYFSSNTAQTGKVTSCNGAMAGQNLNFSFADCDSSLTAQLMNKNVTGVSKQKCGPPLPSGAIRVGFDVVGGATAVNVIGI